ncbi:MAG: hypothetical protein JNK75_02085 [Betaproteobacteria bacterium]|nr:hypothetical protein [Betaproteobacteria bacterium]
MALLAGALDTHAQSGPRGGRGGPGGPGGEGRGNAQQAPRGDARPQAAPVTDPMAALERELPSLRLDLKLASDQTALFDSFSRSVRDAAEAARARVKRLHAFNFDDTSTVSAASIVQTVTEADVARAEAMRATGERMDVLYATFNPDQRRLFDRRIMQSQREPLGNS